MNPTAWNGLGFTTTNFKPHSQLRMARRAERFRVCQNGRRAHTDAQGTRHVHLQSSGQIIEQNDGSVAMAGFWTATLRGRTERHALHEARTALPKDIASSKRELMTSAPCILLRLLIISPECQRKGAGTLLMQLCLDKIFVSERPGCAAVLLMRLGYGPEAKARNTAS